MRVPVADTANSAAPLVNYSGLGALFTVNLRAGRDVLTVNGNSTSEAITVNTTTVTASGQAITYAATGFPVSRLLAGGGGRVDARAA